MIKKRKSQRTKAQQEKAKVYMRFGLIILALLCVFLIGLRILKPELFGAGKYTEKSSSDIDASQPEMVVDLLTVNPYSRPGIESEKITGIVIHYTANPGSSAKNNRDYFEGLMKRMETKASSHFIVGLEGEIIQAVPTWEVAYASNERNKNTVSIETCHETESGEFSEPTYQSVVQLTAWLCQKFGLDEKDVIRHYDITGKNCPKYYVENEEAWKSFRLDVKQALKNSK